MGGDTTTLDSPLIYSTEESSLDRNFPKNSLSSRTFLSGGDHFGSKVENGKAGLGFMDSEKLVRASSVSMDEVNRKRERNVYMDVLKSYDELQLHKDRLKEAKSKISSYTPGSWIEEVGGVKKSDYNIPKKMTLLLIGPKASGKSSLVNKISMALEDDPFTPQRAPISYSSVGDGTYFLQEYTIPRGSSSFCLYDTRSLSDDLTENKKMVKQWMTKGVRHGELIKRDSDDAYLKSKMKSKDQNSSCAIEAKVVNFVIFVVSAVSIFELMDSDDETKRQKAQAVATIFNDPLLSFKDDKPVVVLTQGDLLSLSDRTRIRMYLGHLLGIHPKKQIFDIPESDDSGTKLTIVNMLRYCLEHADKNLPFKGPFGSKDVLKILGSFLLGFVVLSILAGIVINPRNLLSHVNIDCHASGVDSVGRIHDESPQSDVNIDWGAIRHLWSD
ncbi:PREDICTED: uncharacterized protein LOC109205564 isoform X1 [Nicotiana attenuata]|uniref:G domain-containing protein n=1 Tax=Nicotiana attenuata TaxID=49451 RepID=A0A314KWL1_NICAT|nr:PREDICTED: uncharacterized protein LOC109205564 isoform X1 [Nicotiana attenuata]OIT33786.1 hypothetical protein A4A49_05057 [Nicotiana attenuata]